MIHCGEIMIKMLVILFSITPKRAFGSEFTLSNVSVCSVVSNSLLLHGLETARLLSVEFSRREYRSGLPFPTSGDLPDPETKPASLVSPASQADSLQLHHLGSHNNV